MKPRQEFEKMLPLLMAMHAVTPTLAPESELALSRQWDFLEACPRLTVTSGENSGFATAFCVRIVRETAFFLTAEHAVNRSAGIQLEYFTRQSYPKPSRVLENVSVINPFREQDFAILSVSIGNQPVPQLPLAKPGQRPHRFPSPGWSIGYERGEMSFRGETILEKKLVRRQEDMAFHWKLEKGPERGRSGGPLLDPSGKVIGIIVASQDERGYALHLDEILAALKSNRYDFLLEK